MRVDGSDISMIRGDSESITVTCYDTKGNKVPFETGDTVFFTVKETVNTDAKVLQKIITEFNDGTAIIEIRPDDTKSLKFKQYVYDVQLNRSDSTVTTIIRPSKFVIDSEVTYD